MMKISIIIPVYNAALSLEKCIGSIQGQTLREMEILCVNDGSSDGSEAVLKRLQAQDPRIRILSQENAGPAIARNRALKEAKGDYIAFIDADDFILDADALERMYEAGCRENVGVVGSLRGIEQDGVISPVALHRKDLEGHPEGRRMSYEEYQYDYHWLSYIYKRSLLADHGIVFPDYRRFQDPPFFVRAMIASGEFYVVPVEYYCYHSAHENYHFNARKVQDIIKGVTDILEMSRQAGLKKLHTQVVDRLDGSFFWDIVEQLAEGEETVRTLMEKANRTVRWEWLSEQWPTGDKELRALLMLKQYERAADLKAAFGEEIQNKHTFGYAVPFYRMKEGGRIVLYAAGNVGHAYYRQLLEKPEYEVALWADANWAQLGSAQGETLYPADQILETEYDYVLVAVEERTMGERIIQDLEALGIGRRKIVFR